MEGVHCEEILVRIAQLATLWALTKMGNLNMRIIAIGMLVVLLSHCASRLEKNSIVLEYADFGPQAMAYPVIGPKRMPWAPDTPVLIGEGKIYVVVFQNLELEQIEDKYNPDPEANIDYRFLRYQDAMRYLDAQIANNILAKVTRQLEQTRTNIDTKLGRSSL